MSVCCRGISSLRDHNLFNSDQERKEMEKDRNIAAHLAALRQSKGLSQEAVAAQANISVRTLQRLEGGVTQDKNTIERVAKVLEITVESLENISLLIKTLPTMIRVPRMKYGDDLARLVEHAHAFLPDYVSENLQIRELANILGAQCDDWNGLLDEPHAKLAAGEELGSQIAELENAGAKLFAMIIKMESGYTGKDFQPILFDTLILSVRENEFPLILNDDLGECTYVGTQETIDLMQP